LERVNLGRLRLQHWEEAEAPNAIMGWTVFQPRREQWIRQRYQLAPPESLRSQPQLENGALKSFFRLCELDYKRNGGSTQKSHPMLRLSTERCRGLLMLPEMEQ
jgi:hypothetical protein